MALKGKMVLITGAARRIGQSLALAVAGARAHVVLHYGNARSEAESTRMEIESLGRKAFLLQADPRRAGQAANLISRAKEYGFMFAIANNAAIFEPLNWENSSMTAKHKHRESFLVPVILSDDLEKQFNFQVFG